MSHNKQYARVIDALRHPEYLDKDDLVSVQEETARRTHRMSMMFGAQYPISQASADWSRKHIQAAAQSVFRRPGEIREVVDAAMGRLEREHPGALVEDAVAIASLIGVVAKNASRDEHIQQKLSFENASRDSASV